MFKTYTPIHVIHINSINAETAGGWTLGDDEMSGVWRLIVNMPTLLQYY